MWFTEHRFTTECGLAGRHGEGQRAGLVYCDKRGIMTWVTKASFAIVTRFVVGLRAVITALLMTLLPAYVPLLPRCYPNTISITNNHGAFFSHRDDQSLVRSALHSALHSDMSTEECVSFPTHYTQSI